MPLFVPAVAPAGANTEVQYNNAGAFGASSNFKYASNVLTVGGANPAFQADSTVVGNGLRVLAQTPYAGAVLEVISSVPDDGLTIRAKGFGGIVIPNFTNFTAPSGPGLQAVRADVTTVLVGPANLQLTSLGAGTGWIDIPTTGASGIGTGFGVNPWIAYAWGAGYWFSDAAAGDVAYRNISGSLRFGTTSGAATMSIAGNQVGVRIATPTSFLHVGGSFATATRSRSRDTTLDSTDFTVLFLLSASFGNSSALLPAAATCVGRIYAIKKVDATAYTVTIDPNGAELIEGAATLVLSAQWESVLIQSDGTGWHVLARK